jgi:hypothetical protein
MVQYIDAVFYKENVEVFKTSIPEGYSLYQEKWRGLARTLALTSLFFTNIEVDKLVIGNLEYDLTPNTDFEWFTFE